MPLIILRRGAFPAAQFELGNNEGQFCTYALICFGRNDGEVTDIVGFLKKNLEPLPFYDYGTDPKTLRYKVNFEQLVEVPINVGGEVGMEGALQFQEALSFDFHIKEF